MGPPLVSVICLCYNQKRFIREAIESVLNQSYPSVQLIVVDDCSSDGSQDMIKQLKVQYPQLEMLLLKENVGNCRAFNMGLAMAKGQYLIDLAADDVLLADRVKIGVEALEEAGKEFGVHFSDAIVMDEDGKFLQNHSDRFPHHFIPQGDIYTEIIKRYFICPPTVMFRKTVMDKLGGYDESLIYEDFDFWVRSSRFFKYRYSKEVLVKKRIVKNALSVSQFKVLSRYSMSTYKVCEKILSLNRSVKERQALNERIRYEIKLNLRLLNFGVALKYLKLLKKNTSTTYV
ncbi:MAG: glycosyltransferase [Cyclobacteriaceae bacterium]|nr:glycosyltransferase [Cyclobacteriaceae bacterium]UYN86260.1 MAG: glycosyltransferase [Cyclobacteriaceae bacterium]